MVVLEIEERENGGQRREKMEVRGERKDLRVLEGSEIG